MATPTQILRIRDVSQRTGLARSTIYALVARGDMPPPIRLTARASGWRSDDIDRWLDERTRISRGEAATA